MTLFTSYRRFVSIVAVIATIFFAFQVNVSGSSVTTVISLESPTAEASLMYCNVTTSASEVPAGSAVTISWDAAGYATYTLNGVPVSGSVGSKTFTNVQENTTFTFVATSADGKSNCTSSVTVRCLPVPPPTCTLTPATRTIMSGESVDLTWSTTNAASASLTTFGSVALSGTRNTGPLSANATYTLTVQGNNGSTVSCQSVITVTPKPLPPTCTLTPATRTIMSGESVDLTWSTTNAASASLTTFGSVALSGTRNTGPLSANATYVLEVIGIDGTNVSCQSVITVTDTPKYCELLLTKTVSKTTAKPGDQITYTITIKNTGTANCTGGGVKIVDVHDPNLTFVSATQSSNIAPGYGSSPLYTAGTRTLQWNGDVLTPGEEGTMTWVAQVNALTCEIVQVIKNVAKATAFELNNFSTWVTSNTVETTATGSSCPVPPPTCVLSPASTTIDRGQSVTLTWTTTHASTTNLTDFGAVSLSGNVSTGALTASKTYTLTVLGKNGDTVTCHSVVNVKDTPPAPACNAFTANPTTVVKGGTSTLAWTTTNATRVVIDTGIGEVAASGSIAVSPLATTLYTLKAYGVGDTEVSCKVTVTVTESPKVPTCESFGASPATLPVGGGSTILSWSTTHGTSVTITPTVGSVGAFGSSTVSVATTTTYTLVVTGASGQSDACTTTVVVPPPQPVPFTCANNVSFAANPTRISRGDGSVLTWSTTGATAVSFDQGITATSLSGSVTVEPTDTTTYTLTATQNGTSIACPVTVTVTSGGGGGGSVSPTCELSISRNSIKRGEEVTLRWNTSRATEIEIVDSKKKVIVTTKDKLADDKEEYLDGSLRVSPTSDTTYTLTAERGSRERVCTVKVDVEDTVVVTQIRDQQPLVSGISLVDVPYTGFEAGPFMTLSFYVLLMAWALYIAYVLVIKRDVIGGYTLARNHIVADTPTPEEIRPDVFVASVRTVSAAPTAYTPTNLPIAQGAVVGYATSPEVKHVDPSPTSFTITDEVVTTLENHAHAKRALLSSDAIRHLVGATKSLDEATATLSDVIAESKAKYPSEDGWVVINERRMRELCEVCQAKPAPSSEAPFVPTVIPEGSGSLAEAIVTGNVVAAYEMIGHRPMFALADAAADMDSVLRARRGQEEVISEMLRSVTASLTDEQIMKIIAALTGALDGTYTDEASAVKMAIMKAVKVVA